MLTVKIGILLDIVGASLLALDVLKHEYLRLFRGTLSSFSNLHLSIGILFKKNITAEDEEIISVTKSIGVIFALFTLTFLIMLEVDEGAIKRVVTYPIICLIALLIAQLLPANMNKFSMYLIRVAVLLITPVVYCVMGIFFVVSYLVQKPIKLSLFLERWCKRDQAPRVLGFILLILGFLLQLIGS